MESCPSSLESRLLSLIGEPIQQGYLPLNWINKWKLYSTVKLPKRWEDRLNDYAYIPRTKEISDKILELLNRLQVGMNVIAIFNNILKRVLNES